jgi:superfamily II DNA/RNA helicase
VRFVILDEGDTLLDQGFKVPILKILDSALSSPLRSLEARPPRLMNVPATPSQVCRAVESTLAKLFFSQQPSQLPSKPSSHKPSSLPTNICRASRQARKTRTSTCRKTRPSFPSRTSTRLVSLGFRRRSSETRSRGTSTRLLCFCRRRGGRAFYSKLGSSSISERRPCRSSRTSFARFHYLIAS